jgi:hypothetical protein
MRRYYSAIGLNQFFSKSEWRAFADASTARSVLLAGIDIDPEPISAQDFDVD